VTTRIELEIPDEQGSRKGRLVKALACQRQARVLAVVADGPARELCRRHELHGDSARLASEGLVAAVLLSAQVKGEERITMEVQGEQPAFALSVDVWGEGRLRGRLTPARLHARDGRFDGFLAAIRSLNGRELYRGVARIEGERFEQALARFLTESEQVDGRVRVHVELNDDGQPAFAAGLLVERFPDLPADRFAALFDEPLQADFRALMTGFAFGQLAGEPVEALDARDLEFRCTCSVQRVRGMLAALGRDEVQSMLDDDGGAEVTCHFCNTRYTVSGDDLAAILRDLPAQA